MGELNVLKKFHVSREDAVTRLMEEYQLSANEAREKTALVRVVEDRRDKAAFSRL